MERFKLSEDGETMEVLIKVDDPGAFTMPWSAVQQFRRQQRPLRDVCPENNLNFFTYDVVPLPQADKPDF